MELSLIRTYFSNESTIGPLAVNGELECWVLEDMVREPGIKIPGATAIPYGRYQIVINFSKRFQRLLPLLLNVPMFDGIRIHPGNIALDTEGCLLTGRKRAENRILESRLAFDPLFEKLSRAFEIESIWIDIRKEEAA